MRQIKVIAIQVKRVEVNRLREREHGMSLQLSRFANFDVMTSYNHFMLSNHYCYYRCYYCPNTFKSNDKLSKNNSERSMVNATVHGVLMYIY